MRTRLHSSLGGPVPEDHSGYRAPVGHKTVLLQESIEGLDLHAGDVVVDATLGGAGHAKAIAEKLDSTGVLVGFDLDQDAIERARAILTDGKPTIHLIQANFRTVGSALDGLGIKAIDKALFDLGWSSFQLTAGRGFSFLNDEPLAMTYAKTGGDVPPGDWQLTAREIVNEWKEESIADVIYGWGEDRYARRIAKAIVERRDSKPIEMSRDLAEIVASAVPGSARNGKIHPATKTFQALRIAVNDEFGAITEGLTNTYARLNQGGRIAVISFHSAEDRIVKRLMKTWTGTTLTKKPIIPSDDEIAKNPRSRSAKLRVFIKE